MTWQAEHGVVERLANINANAIRVFMTKIVLVRMLVPVTNTSIIVYTVLDT